MNSLSVSKYDLSVVPGLSDMVTNNSSAPLQSILKLNKMECRTANNAAYNVIRYDKSLLAIDLIPTYGLCRSIIVNHDGKIVGFAPPKGLHAETFIKNYPMPNDNIVAQEFIEGTMVNVFFDPSLGVSGGWEISTRNTVGATSVFYKTSYSEKKTFRDMFLDAALYSSLDINKLNPAFSYSFVLQHPDNRIVVPFKHPALYLVAMYRIDGLNVEIYNIDQGVKDFFSYTKVNFPKQYEFEQYSELVEKYASPNTPYTVLGVIIYNKVTGERTKIRNPVYEQVRGLRGNQPKLQFQYLTLRHEGKVKDYLKYYPENKKEFSEFRDNIHLFTEALYANYVSCYIKKEKPLKEFPEKFRTHMYNLHQKYLTDLREQKLFITNTMVQKYVNELAPSLLMYCLNYDMRKRNVDLIKAEAE